MTALSLVREAIVRAVPEIMELKSGCVVKHFLKGTGTILRVENYDGESDCYYIGFLSLPEPIFELQPLNANWDILGRPITLADVLRAIGNKHDHSAVNLGGFTRDLLNGGWNLTQPLEGQSESVIKFLANLFTP